VQTYIGLYFVLACILFWPVFYYGLYFFKIQLCASLYRIKPDIRAPAQYLTQYLAQYLA